MAAVAIALLVAVAVWSGQRGREEPAGSPVRDVRQVPALEASLLTAGDLDALAGAPTGIQEVPADDAGLTQDPDPRTPCGDRASLPPWETAAVTSFTWSRAPLGVVAHAVWELPPASGERLFSEFRRDLDPGCPAYRSRTPTGEQEVTLLDEIEIEDAGDADAVAWTSRISVGPAGGFGAAGVAQRGERFAIVFLISEGRLPDGFVAGAVEAAARRL